jgi:hypothetical protein
MGKIKYAHKIIFGKPEENRLLGRPRRRWEDCLYRNRILRSGLDSIDSRQRGGIYVHAYEPLVAVNGRNFLD